MDSDYLIKLYKAYAFIITQERVKTKNIYGKNTMEAIQTIKQLVKREIETLENNPIDK